MASIGKIKDFDQESEDWSIYVERLRLFLKCNKIRTENQVPTVLTLIGSKTYTLLRSLVFPDSPDSKDVEEIFSILATYFQPIPCFRTERFRFQQKFQSDGEEINEFAAMLKKFSLFCNFEKSLEERLLDQFIFGLKDSDIQEKLLTYPDLSFTKAVAVAISINVAKKDAISLCTKNSQMSASNAVYQIASRKTSSSANVKNSNVSHKLCKHCGRSNHLDEDCKFRLATCFNCGITGHLRNICKSKLQPRGTLNPVNKSRRKSRSLNEVAFNEKALANHKFTKCKQSEKNEEENSLSLFSVTKCTDKPIELSLQVDRKLINFEVDTGAAVSIITAKTFQEKFSNHKLVPTELRLKTFSGEMLVPLGKIIVTVEAKGKLFKDLELFVLPTGNKSLVGRPWLDSFGILDFLSKEKWVLNCDLKKNHQSQLNALLGKYSSIFQDTLGEFKNMKAHLVVKEKSEPKFFKARPVPFAIKPQLERELRKLQNQNIISPVNSAKWASPIVTIIKKDKTMRICGDYKVGLNPNLVIDHYPLPKIEDMFTQLKNGAYFTKLDLAQAYQQMLIDDESKELVTINTHLGLFQVNRLPFGVASSPAIFQRTMDQILVGLPGVMCYLDDILCSGETLEDHFKNLDKLLDRISNAGIHLKKDKCEFFKERIEYLGHIIDRDGLHPGPGKIKDALEAQAPKDVSQLRSFLGLVSYYRKFLPNLATVLAPLYKLLEKNQKWCWNAVLDGIFEKVKKLILSPKVLMRFDPDLPVSLACDASSYGLGAVISHILPDGSDRPIAFASRSLLDSEKRYAQIDREALGIVFGLKKFHQYLYGRKFILITDHKPLTRIFHPGSAIPTLAAARLQRWALILATYEYNIIYRKSEDHANADVWSRLPSKVVNKSLDDEDAWEVFATDLVEDFPVDSRQIAKCTTSDPILAQVRRYAIFGWPASGIPKEFDSFFRRKEEISIMQDCILWGNRVIIPKNLRFCILKELHKGHVGVVKMKMLARSYFWWPGLDEDINQTAKACQQCRLQSNNPAKAPLHPWTWPTRPWQRIHLDFAGPFKGETFLIAVDAHSKWPEVHRMKSISASKTIEVLFSWIARFGIPEHIVSDNGTQFTSKEFQDFCKSLGIRHSRSAPYHPASNGQAERFVQVLKTDLKKKPQDVPFDVRVNQLLFSYRSTPHLTTKETPARLFLHRQVRTVLDLLRPSVESQVSLTQDKQCLDKMRSCRKGDIVIGQHVLVRSYRKGEKWLSGLVVKQSGPVSFKIKLSTGQICSRHLDQIIPSLGDVGHALERNSSSGISGKAQESFTSVRRSPRIQARNN